MTNETLVSPSRTADSRRSRTVRRRRLRPLLIVAAALVVAVLGAGQAAAILKARSAPINSDTVTLGGLTLHLQTVEWVSFEADDPALQDPSATGGYQMPGQMMPDMPADGDARLNLEVNLADSTGHALPLDTTKEFSVGGGAEGKLRPLEGDTFGDLGRINSGNAVDGKLFFDMKAPQKTDPPLYLQWARGGEKVKVLITPGGTATTHHH